MRHFSLVIFFLANLKASGYFRDSAATHNVMEPYWLLGQTLEETSKGKPDLILTYLAEDAAVFKATKSWTQIKAAAEEFLCLKKRRHLFFPSKQMWLII